MHVSAVSTSAYFLVYGFTKRITTIGNQSQVKAIRKWGTVVKKTSNDTVEHFQRLRKGFLRLHIDISVHQIFKMPFQIRKDLVHGTE